MRPEVRAWSFTAVVLPTKKNFLQNVSTVLFNSNAINLINCASTDHLLGRGFLMATYGSIMVQQFMKLLSPVLIAFDGNGWNNRFRSWRTVIFSFCVKTGQNVRRRGLRSGHRQWVRHVQGWFRWRRRPEGGFSQRRWKTKISGKKTLFFVGFEFLKKFEIISNKQCSDFARSRN